MTALGQQWGLSRPRPGLGTWPPDAHLALAVVLAVPVWTALGLLAGPLMYRPSTWIAWMSFALVQPVAEELLFRGILQGEVLRLAARNAGRPPVGPVSRANVLVTVAFVAAHLPAQPLGWALAVSVPSLIFGHLRERFASAWPSALVHAVYNAGFGLAAWLAIR